MSNRKTDSEKQRLRKEREEFKAKQAKVRKITAIITVSVILVILLTVLIGIISYNIRMNGGEYLRAEIAASSRTIDVNGSMMTYYFNDVYNTFVDYYGSYVEYYGLDTAKPLKRQEISDGESWFDYFMSGARQTVSNVLMLNEAAAAEGIALTEAEKTAVLNRAATTDEGLYGRGVKTVDIENAKLLEALAYKYQFMKEKEFEPSEREIMEYYSKNAKNFQTVDLYSFPLYYSETGMTETEVQSWADKLLASKTTEEFEDVVKQVLRAEDPDSTEDLTAHIEGLMASGMLYTEGNEISEWAFQAKAGDTVLFRDPENTTYTVCMLVQAPNRSERETVTVRHILLSDKTYGSREKALKAAEKVLAAYESGERTEEAFALLALEHSDDAGSYYNGGLYINIEPDTMLTEFNDWCFDASRKVGEHGVIETARGCHIIYFVGDGPEAWEAGVIEAIKSEQIDEYLQELSEQYPTVFDDTVLAEIPD